MRFLRIIAALIFGLLAPGGAFAQQVPLQAGPWTAGHAPMYSGSGGTQPIIQDSGTAAGGAAGIGMGEGLYVARGTGTPPYDGTGSGPMGTNWCDYDGPTTAAAGYHYLCLSANVDGDGLIAYGAGGVATPGNLTLNINGTAYEFPFTISGIVGPVSSVVNDLACWNNTTGTLLKDCTVTSALDQLSSTQGAVLYRGASGWAGLAPGTAGQVLKTQGSGANPAWTDTVFSPKSFNVRAYGATGDGTTNDTAAFAAAVAASNSAGLGSDVYIPCGHYVVDGVTSTAGFRIRGDGLGCVELIQNTNAAVFTVNNSSEVDFGTFSDFSCRLSNGGGNVACIRFSGSGFISHWLVENIGCITGIICIQNNQTTSPEALFSWNTFNNILTVGTTYSIYFNNGSGTGNVFTNLNFVVGVAGAGVVYAGVAPFIVGDITISNVQLGGPGIGFSFNAGAAYKSNITISGVQCDAGITTCVSAAGYNNLSLMGIALGGGVVNSIAGATNLYCGSLTC